MEKRESEGAKVDQHSSELWDRLATHGYDEKYLIGRHTQTYGRKRSALKAIVAILLLCIAIACYFAYSNGNFGIKNSIPVTGFSTIDLKEGCCEDLCAQTLQSSCSGAFHSGQYCKQIQNCKVGCCVDDEGYCLTNYLKGNCNSKSGSFQTRKCKDVLYCKFGTNKPLVAHDEAQKLEERLNFSGGISEGVGYYGEFLALRHVVSPTTNVQKVEAVLKKGGVVVSIVQLHDDGNYLDGSRDDGIFSTMWDTTLVSSAYLHEPIVTLSMDVKITKSTGVEVLENTQTITLLVNNYCFPLTYPPKLNSKNIAIMGEGYADPTHYRNDVSTFLGRLYASGNLSKNIRETNLYRIDRMATLDTAGTIEYVRTECPTFDARKDTMIILKRGAPCTQEAGVSAIWVEPRTFFNKSISNMSYLTFEGFCPYAIAEQSVADQIEKYMQGPLISILSGNMSIINTTIANTTFSFDYPYRPVYYEVYLDSISPDENGYLPLIGSGQAMDSNPILLRFPASFGEHTLVLKAWRFRYNVKWEEQLLNVTVGSPPDDSIIGGVS